MNEYNRTRAINHVKLMDDKFHKEIQHSVNNSCIYESKMLTFPLNKKYKSTKSYVTPEDSVQAIFSCGDKNIAVLNFASFKNPGGRFLDGSMAQEEFLCHHSTLYNVLREFNNAFYKPNKKLLNRGLYADRLIYSKDILFIGPDNNIKKADVITCAAPNIKPGLKYKTITMSEVEHVLVNRILLILNAAYKNNVDTLILGAFGCGVFGNDPAMVSNIFEILLYKFDGCFDKVVFAIPYGNNNHAIFEYAFKGGLK